MELSTLEPIIGSGRDGIVFEDQQRQAGREPCGLRCDWLRPQLYKNHLKGFIAQIFNRVLGPRGLTDLPSLRVALLCLPVREGELHVAVGEPNDDACGMLVHRGAVVRVMVDTQHSYLRILDLHFVVLRIDLDGVLGRRG